MSGTPQESGDKAAISKPKLRKCRECHERVPIEAIARRRDGSRRLYCRPCWDKLRMREWREKNPERSLGINRKSQSKEEVKLNAAKRQKDTLHSPRKMALNAVGAAVRTGRLVKPSHCQICGRYHPNPRTLHAHHFDYSEPLKVIWVCGFGGCHAELDRQRRLLESIGRALEDHAVQWDEYQQSKRRRRAGR